MAITLRGSGENSAIDGGDLTVTFPGGVAQDDQSLVTFGSSVAGAPNLTFSTSGYTTLCNRDSGADPPSFGSPEILVGIKKQGATPDSTCAVLNAAGTSDSTVGEAQIFVGVDTTTAIDATTTKAGGTGVAADSPSTTTVTNNAWVVSCVAVAVTDTSVTKPSGYSNQVDINADDTRDVTCGMASVTKATAGAEDPGAWSGFGADTQTWAAATVALRPAAAVGGGFVPPNVLAARTLRVMNYGR